MNIQKQMSTNETPPPPLKSVLETFVKKYQLNAQKTGNLVSVRTQFFSGNESFVIVIWVSGHF